MPTSKEELIRRGIPLHDIQHSQHRRAEWQDYGGCGLYMVTLCVDGRQPLFGHLEGNIRARREDSDFPHIVLSSLGKDILNNELPKIHHYYQEVELWKAAIMPDHIHLLLYVARPLPKGKRLGHVLAGFMGGCSRAWWAQMAVERTAAESTAADAAGTTAAAAVNRPPLFEAGFHDRIIKRAGMLDIIKRYMNDNPLRALMRRQLPLLMECQLHLRIGSHEYAAFGSLFLLKRAEKEQVFFHRKDKKTGMPTELTEKYQQDRAQLLAEAREGVVLVSPAISKGEKQLIDTAINEGLPVIQLQKEPIGRYWKPERRRFEGCARGALLILSPWGLDEELKRSAVERTAAEETAADAAGTTAGAGTTAAVGAPSDYARFHRLNELAAEICATTDVTLLNLREML